jgi:uncharacterized membrane protein YvlD (DUF360 family)
MVAVLRWAIRLGAAWAVNTGAIVLLAWILPGFEIAGLGSALVMAAVIALLGATLRPLLVWWTLRLIVLTGGLLSLVISAAVILLGTVLVEGVEMRSAWDALGVVVGLGLINAVAGLVLPFDDDLSYFRGVVRRTGKRHQSAHADGTPGLIMFEIDGLAESVLHRAVDAGLVPTMARWLAEGTHVLTPWECDLSSQTGASQAGILHGDNGNMPAFRWLEKNDRGVVVSNHPDDAAENERRRRPGRGLLEGGGSAVGNMFSGGAEQSMITMSRVADNYRTRIPSFYTYFADPQHYVRMVAMSVHDIVLEKMAARSQRRRDERPRVDRGGVYPLTRAATTVALRELGVYLMIAEMYRGVPAMYATFVGYDEVAHHSGPERRDALQVLKRLDKQLARLERAARGAPRPYRFVVLSDHGQSPGTPFRQLYGQTLVELVAELCGSRAPRAGAPEDEGIGAVNTALTETIADPDRIHARIARRSLGERVHDDRVEVAPEAPATGDAERQDEEEESPVVMVSGCLGLVYLPEIAGRADRREIDTIRPGLVEGLARHPGIAFVMVRDGEEGPVAISAVGRHRLSDGHVEGADPLHGMGANAVAHLLRTDGFPDCPDILINGRYDPVSGEAIPFEEFAGSHGGLGGAQMHPFLLHPADLDAGSEPVVGAEAVNAILLEWRAQLAREVA